MKNQLHILLVAASPVRRSWLSDLVRTSFPRESVKVVTRVEVSRGIVRREAADVLLADLATPAAAVSMVEVLRNSPGAAGSVALLDDPDPRWVGSALEAGVNAIISRDLNSEELQLAIGAAEAGLVLLQPSSAPNLTARRLQPPGFARDVEQLPSPAPASLPLITTALATNNIPALPP